MISWFQAFAFKWVNLHRYAVGDVHVNDHDALAMGAVGTPYKLTNAVDVAGSRGWVKLHAVDPS